MDFLRYHGLCVDVAAGRLTDREGIHYPTLARPSPPTASVLLGFIQPYQPASTINAGAASAGPVNAGAASAGPVNAGPARAGATGGQYRRLLSEFPAVECVSKRLPPVSHDVVHHIVTTGPPIASKFRKLDGEKLAAAKAEFKQLEEDGIVQRSTSPWSSPLHMVKKSNGGWRPCGDFRRLNLVTEPDVYPLPNMLDFAAKAAGCTVFSKIDLRKGYHQIPVNPADVPKTAITTPFGLFEYLRMGFGLRNAGASFQRHVDRAIRNVECAFAWVDDIIICSRTHAEHVDHVRQVLQALQDHGMVINGEKCEWGKQQLEYLGHKISAAGVLPLPTHVAAIQDFPQPSTVKELQAFLGMVNFYRRFLPGVARTLRPLTDELRGGRKGPDKLDWSDTMGIAFASAKQALLSATHLAHPTTGAALSVVVDASATHVGACLQQQLTGRKVWQPLGFFSKKLDPAQEKYSAFDRELFACFAGIRHFRHMLEGRRFAVYTDHKPLTYALSRVSDPWTPRQCRQLSYVAEYTSDIRHIAGSANVVADTLSRPPPLAAASKAVAVQGGKHNSGPAVAASVADVQPAVGISFTKMAEHQKTCTSTLQASKSTSLTVQTVQVEGASLLCDVARGITRPLVPEVDRRAVFNAIHGVAHPGIRATRRMIAGRFVWKGIGRDVAAMCRDCQHCQRGKVHKQPAAPLHPIPVPARRFSHVHVDLVGPLPASAEGHVYLLTAVDRSTRWVEAIPLRNMEATTCVDNFISGWVARFGVPSTVTTDRGTQFTSAVWAAACTRLGIKHVLTTAFHPQANGMVERVHRQIKDGLRARGAGAAWHTHLPWVLLGLRAAPKEDSGVSSAELVQGTPLILPGQLGNVPEPPRVHVAPPPTRPASYADAVNTPPAHLAMARWVYVRRGGQLKPLQDPYAGPFLVEKKGAKYFILKIGQRSESVSVDRLKMHSGTAPVSPAMPAPRGRPTKQAAA